jgi:hypothetical protein
MTSTASPKDAKRQRGTIVDLLIDALARLELEPRLVPPGRIEWLSGGLSCIELEAKKGVDIAILLSQSPYGTAYLDPLTRYPRVQYRKDGTAYLEGPQALYKVDYAVRGNIKGVLSGRIISETALKTKGLVKKRITELIWEIPPADRGADASRLDYQTEIEGLSPGPGEVWEGGPHQKLTELLNHDADIIDSIKGFGERRRDFFLSLFIASDRKGESIRISTNLWLKPQELLATYATPDYLGMVNRIGRHIKGIRGEFGGLAF